jgi:heme/copper-type cytochrome/quinol oxidase subunit 2
MAKWSRETENIVEFAILSIFGFGIALYLGSVFLTAMPTGSTSATAVNSIIGGFASAITNVLVPIIAIVFVLFLYLIVKHSGILGGKKE